MRRIVLLFALVACGTPPTRKARLVDHCSSSADCKSESNGCNYCYANKCSCTLPADPIRDAGAD